MGRGRGPRRRSLTLALAVLAAATGCAGGWRGADRGELIPRLLPSTVQLRAERQGGLHRAASGVVLATDPATSRAWIVTARHFLDPPGPHALFVRRPGQSKEAIPATVFARSEDLDVAILEVRGLVVQPAALKMMARLGDDVLVVSFPWGRRLTVVGGIVSQIAVEDGQLPIAGPPRMIDASVSYGSSGGGVFDIESGALIAIVESHRTARVALPERRDRPLEIPVAGETTVVSAEAIRQLLISSGLERFLAR